MVSSLTLYCCRLFLSFWMILTNIFLQCFWHCWLSFPSGSGRSPAAKRFLVHFKHYFNRERIEFRNSNSKIGVLIYNIIHRVHHNKVNLRIWNKKFGAWNQISSQNNSVHGQLGLLIAGPIRAGFRESRGHGSGPHQNYNFLFVVFFFN